MKKNVKMVVYGEPGVGKSTFVTKAPKPFWIATDGNYAWLDLPEKDHVEVNTWAEAKKIFADIESGKYDDYETIVVDLLEDLFKWTEFEFCKKNGISHVSELPFGRAYDETRNDFFIEISKLLAVDKNIVLIMHGMSISSKDRRGVEFTKFVPSNRLPDKVLDQIEGRVRYFLRAFAVTEENTEGHLVTKRYLSLSPDGTTEYGICRGLNGETTPRNIPLDWNDFLSTIGLTSTIKEDTSASHEEPSKKATPDTIIGARVEAKKAEEIKKIISEPKVELKLPKVENDDLEDIPTTQEKVVEEPKKVEEPVVQAAQEPKENKIEALKAKLAAIKAAQGK